MLRHVLIVTLYLFLFAMKSLGTTPNIIENYTPTSSQTTTLNDQDIQKSDPKMIFNAKPQIIRQKKKVKAEVSKQVLSKETIQRFSVGGGLFADTTQVIKSLPGVVSSGPNAILYIRGGRVYESLQVVDNFLYRNPYFFGGLISKVNPKLVDKITFYAGGFPARYGSILSAVIDIEQINGNLKKTVTDIDTNLTELNIISQGPIEPYKSSWLIATRRTYYDVLGKFFVENTLLPFYESYFGKLFFKLTPQHKLSLQVSRYHEAANIINEDESNTTLKGVDGIEFDFNTDLYQLRLIDNWTKHIETELSIGQEITGGTFSISGDLPGNATLEQKPLLTAFETRLKGFGHVLSTGVQLFSSRENQDIRFTIPPKPDYEESVTRDRTIRWQEDNFFYHSTYIQDEWTPLPKLLSINGGVRYEWVPLTETPRLRSIQPRLLLYLGDRERSVFTLSTGLFTSFIGSLRTLETRLQDLKPEAAIHYNAGYELNIAPNWMFRTELFHKDYQDLVYTQRSPTSGIITQYTNDKKGVATGLEVFIEKKETGPWSGWLSYTYSRIKYWDQDDNWYYADHDQRHTVSLTNHYKINEIFTLVGKAQIASGKPHTAIQGNLGELGTGTGIYIPNEGPKNGERIPWYNRFDLWLEVNSPDSGWQFYVGMINIFNTPNIAQYGYNEDYTEQNKVSLLPRIPILGFKMSF